MSNLWEEFQNNWYLITLTFYFIPLHVLNIDEDEWIMHSISYEQKQLVLCVVDFLNQDS